LDLAGLPEAAPAVARRTRNLGDPPAPHARRTGTLHGEAGLTEADLPRTAALRALPDRRARGRPRPGTGGALLGDGDVDRDLPPLHRDLEVEVDHVFDVLPLPGARPPPSRPSAAV